MIWGSGIGGLGSLEQEIEEFARGNGQPRYNPFMIPKMIADIAAGHISIKYGFRGVNYATVSACASSSHALINAFDYIRLGRNDIVIAGGSEAAIIHAGVGGGATADAYHITAPHPDGFGARNVMRLALADAGMAPEDIDYVNVHGTSTPLGDVAEARAIQQVFGAHAYALNISSTKSMTGHLLGAAGAIEAIAGILAIQHQFIPPTINHFTDDPELDPKLNLTFNVAQERSVRAILSNTFGFGGHNSSLILRKFDS